MKLECSRCGETKPEDAFYPIRESDGRRDPFCRRCRSEYSREHYEKHRDRYIKKAARRKREERERRQSLIIDYLREHPCVDCGETDVVVLDFDHVGEKSFNVSHGIQYLSWRDVLKEIEKCEVRCANCHRRRTTSRFQDSSDEISRQRTALLKDDEC